MSVRPDNIKAMQQQSQQDGPEPAGSGKLPSGRHGLSRDVVIRSQRERMVEAMVSVVAAKGFTDTTVADIIAVAGVSRATFYEQFADKEDCFIAAYSTVMGRMLTYVAEGFSRQPDADWTVRIRDAISALLVYLATNPVAARVGIVEGFGAGARARDRYQQAVTAFFPFLDEGRSLTADGDRIPPRVARVVLGGISTMMFNEASTGRAEHLPELLPEMMFLTIAPYLGRERAFELMKETEVPS